MFSYHFQVGNVNVYPGPFLFFLLVICPVALIIGVIFLSKRIKSMIAYCQAGEYEKSISLAYKLLNRYTRSRNMFRTKSLQRNIEIVHFYLAISYLGLSKYAEFWECINKLELQKNLKNSWIAVYYILQKDVAEVKRYTEQIEPTEDMQVMLPLLKGVVLCEEGQADEGKERLTEILPKIKTTLLKQIISQYIS